MSYFTNTTRFHFCLFLVIMCAAKSQPKKKGDAVTAQQKSELIDYMYDNHLRVVGQYTSAQGKLAKDIVWEDLAVHLNALPNGTQKSVQQWRNVIHSLIQKLPDLLLKLTD